MEGVQKILGLCLASRHKSWGKLWYPGGGGGREGNFGKWGASWSVLLWDGMHNREHSRQMD